MTVKHRDGSLAKTNVSYTGIWPAERFIEFRRLTDDVVYIRLASLRAEAAAPDLKDQGPLDPSGHAIAALDAAKARISEAFSKAMGASCLVLDLRGNSGGTDLLGSHVAMHLVPGEFTYFKLQTRFSPQLRTVPGFEDSAATNGWSSPVEWGPPRPPTVTAFPGFIVVLQDERCFSTTDNLLACLRDFLPRDRARFVGRPSGGGTGAPRPVVTLPESGATLTLTVMKVYSPEGRLIEGRGTIPDRLVEWSWDDVVEGRDADLDAGLQEASVLIKGSKVY
jgi:C-terminal processing protease CtpA/Prc